MYDIRAATNWAGVVAASELDRGTKFCLLTLGSLLPGYGTVSLSSKKQLVSWLQKVCQLEEKQVESCLQKAHRAGFLRTTTDASQREWTLHTTFPRPAVDPVINTHQDAVIIKAKTWEEAVAMVLETEVAK